ncbi:MAG: type I-MYXAN CRISPR-associated protein Cas6/Cmx6 [Burkholderiales bacterium]|nr:MAG: type I-MYXAN CRISPR-associated protein Cas6/Cmx6 [Burkholderiales bacterium]
MELMTLEHAAMVDLVFDLAGESLPRDYRRQLWSLLAAQLPWLEDDPHTGLHPIRVPPSDGGELLLSRRAKLTLRLPAARAGDAAVLENRELELAGRALRIGGSRVRRLEPFPTLKAAFVAAGASDEAALEREVGTLLETLGMGSQRFICGRMQALAAGAERLQGSSVVLHDLKPVASLSLQSTGLGPHRHLGCGILVPHKTISGLD